MHQLSWQPCMTCCMRLWCAQVGPAAGAKPGQPGWAFPPFSSAGLTPAAGFPAHQQAFLQPNATAGPLQQQQQQQQVQNVSCHVLECPTRSLQHDDVCLLCARLCMP